MLRPDRPIRPADMPRGPVRQVFTPVAVAVGGGWRFAVLRGWHRTAEGWTGMVEYTDATSPQGSTTLWVWVEPETVVPLAMEEIRSRRGAWIREQPPRPPAGAG